MLAKVINFGSIASYGSALDKTPTLPSELMFKNIRLT